ncbi:MAG: hypothetical protein WD231_01075 [Candidatus Woykebacteria bacterium]
MKKPALIKALGWLYLVVFLSFVGMVILLHAIPKPFLDIIRMPTFIRAAEPYLGFSYTPSLHVYQATLLFFIFLVLVDSLSLFNLSSKIMKKASALSSFVGFILIGTVFFYFLYALATVGVASSLTKTILIYLLLTSFLMSLDLFTFVIDEELIYHLPLAGKGRDRKD